MSTVHIQPGHRSHIAVCFIQHVCFFRWSTFFEIFFTSFFIHPLALPFLTCEYTKHNEGVINIADEDNLICKFSLLPSLLMFLPSIGFKLLLVILLPSVAYYPFQGKKKTDWEYSSTDKDKFTNVLKVFRWNFQHKHLLVVEWCRVMFLN